MSTPISDPAATDRQPFLAFVVDEASESLMLEITEALLLPRECIRRSTMPEARQYLAEIRSPSLLVVDIDNLDDPLNEIIALSEVCELGTQLLVVGSNNDVGLFRELLGIGAADYLIKPLTNDQVMASISSLEEGGMGLSIMGRTGKIISVMSSRGGVGARTVVAPDATRRRQ